MNEHQVGRGTQIRRATGTVIIHEAQFSRTSTWSSMCWNSRIYKSSQHKSTSKFLRK